MPVGKQHSFLIKKGFEHLFCQQGAFSIFMGIWDEDYGISDDKIDIVFGSYRSLAAGRHSAHPTIYKRTVSMKSTFIKVL